MKKYYSLLFALLAVMAMALVFVSCKKEIDYEEPKPESKNQMTFTTGHPVGKTMWVFLKKDERPTEVIGAKEIYGENPFDGGIPINEIILGLELENQTVTIKGDITYIEFNEPKNVKAKSNRIKRTYLPTELVKVNTTKMTYIPVTEEIKAKYSK